MKPLRNKLILSIVCYLLYTYIRLVYRTTRWQYRNAEFFYTMQRQGKPLIIAFWHGRLAMMPNFAPLPENVHAMVSRHGDGEFVARVCGHFGLQRLRGSTNRDARRKGKDRGGASALREAVRLLRRGQTVAITPDGPRGPRMRVSGAIAEIARLSGAPVLPITFSAANARVFGSWDRFVLPLPFGRACFIAAEPVSVPADASGAALKKARKTIENRLNRITREADQLMGLKPVEPAPENR